MSLSSSNVVAVDTLKISNSADSNFNNSSGGENISGDHLPASDSEGCRNVVVSEGEEFGPSSNGSSIFVVAAERESEESDDYENPIRIDDPSTSQHRPDLVEKQISHIAELSGSFSTTDAATEDREIGGAIISPDDTLAGTSTWNFASSETRNASIISSATTDHNEKSSIAAVAAAAEYCGEEFIASTYLRQRLKHVFILSAAGKPIYSRYGFEEELSSLMGVMQALVSFVSRHDQDENKKDELISIKSGGWICVFHCRGPLILVAASRATDSFAQLEQLLGAVHQEIFFFLTSTQVTRIFENRTNFDLRRFLSGTESFFQSMINLTELGASLFLRAVRVHSMNPAVRSALGQAMALYAANDASKPKHAVVFALLVANNQLVSITRMKRYSLDPSDLNLIINLVTSNSGLRNGETWAPLCLPKFDKTGFLQAHISYLTEDCPACLLLLTVDRSPVAFDEMSSVKKKIVERLDKLKVLPLLSECVRSAYCFRLSEMGITDLWHFLYKSQSGQFTCPAFDHPYKEPGAQKRLFAAYLKLHHRMHTSGQKLRLVFTSGRLEAVLGIVESSFELYAVFAPLTTKAAASAKAEKLREWLKGEEKQLFILNSPVY